MQLTKRERIFAVIVAVVLLLFGLVYFKGGGSDQQDDTQLRWQETTAGNEKPVEDQGKKEPEKPAVYVVDVKGAVNSPGVYQVTEGDRVIDVIRDAGGFTKKANQKQINLAGLLKDEMVVYVPFQGETAKQWEAAAPSSKSEGEKINVNRADAKTLEQLPGIGPAKAEAIITYREEQGLFEKAEDLLEVSGIGDKSLEQLRDKITF